MFLDVSKDKKLQKSAVNVSFHKRVLFVGWNQDRNLNLAFLSGRW